MSRYRALVQEKAELEQERAKLKTEGAAIYAKLDVDARSDKTAEEDARLEQIRSRIAAIDADLATGGRIGRGLAEEEERRAWERNVPAIEIARFTGGHDLAGDAPWGYGVIHATEEEFLARHPAAHLAASDRNHPRNVYRAAALGEFLQAVASAGSPGGRIEPRLYGAASGLSSGVGADGGFLVQSQMSMELLQSGFAAATLAPMCQHVQLGEGADSLDAPIIDQTSRANGSRWGGVRVYRRAEADTVTASKPKFGEWEVRLEDLMAICYATDRTLRDALALGTVMQQSFSEEFAFKVDDELVRGSGVGEILGILNAPALVSVAKETGQAAATIVGENLSNMWQRLWTKSRPNACWCINQDCEPQLFKIFKAVGIAGLEYPFITYAPDGTMRIFGRPVYAIEQAETIGTVGDIMLCDWYQMALIEKGGIQADSSIHVRFLYGERTFRWIYPINGRPKWKSAVTPFKGGASNTRSPYVVLATRA